MFYAFDRDVADTGRWDPPNTEVGYRVPVPGDEDIERPDAEVQMRLRRRMGDAADTRNSNIGGSGSRESERRVVDYETNRWTGVSAIALGLGGIGVVIGNAALVLSSVVGAVFVGIAGTLDPPRLLDAQTGEARVSVNRKLETESPDPGEDLEVTVEVHNEGTTPLTDVRVVDGVPAALAVTDGSPRHGTFLAPGDRTRFSYTVTATRGVHHWNQATVVIADPGGSTERETTVPASSTLHCRLPLLDGDRLPLRGIASQYAGRIETDSGGPGVEFHATREYRSSDPLSRIDWYRRAKTGDLATLEFREERAAKVMLVVDTRQAAYLAPTPDGYHAVERSVDVAQRIFTALLETGDRVGITTFGPSANECWLSPGIGDEHRALGRELLNSHPSLSPVPPGRGLYATYRAERRETLKRERIAHLHRRLAPNTQVLFLSPCCDDYAVTIAQRLDAYGHLVTVVSPDPTVADTPRHERAMQARMDRLRELRRAGVRVVDWDEGDSFTAALANAEARWSA